VAGHRARQTRARLLDCLREQLDEARFREITVTQLARMAGTSPAAFYQYFPDIDTALLALAQDVAAGGARLQSLVEDQSWRRQSATATVERLVDGFLEFWRENESVLRVVDLATLEGDERFHRIRVEMLNHIAKALAAIVEEQQAGKGDDAPHTMAMAGTLVGMLAHVSAHQSGFEAWSIPMTEVRASVVRLVHWGVTGRKPTR
jgi:AcrR family transcriptional regulator